MGEAVLAFVVDHEAGEGLEDGVHRGAAGERAGLAEARDGEVEDAGFAPRDRVVTEAEAPEDAGAEAFEQHVGALDQSPQHVLAALGFQIQRDRALAEVGRDRVGGVGAVARGDGAAPVAIAGRLDLDDVGAVLRHQHPAVRTRHALREVDDLQPGERRVVAHERTLPDC